MLQEKIVIVIPLSGESTPLYNQIGRIGNNISIKPMYLVPFGEVKEDRFEISEKYNLIEQVNGIWRLTSKCKKNYNEMSYFRYLKGEIEKPTKPSEAYEPSKGAIIQDLLKL